MALNAMQYTIDHPGYDECMVQSTSVSVNALVGTGACAPHFGEFLQGAFEIGSESGPRIMRALVSVHMPTEPGSVARFEINPFLLGDFTAEPGCTGITVIPSHYHKCEKAARLALNAYGLFGVGGILKVDTFVPEGGGMGSSTTGVVATVRAVTAAISGYTGASVPAGPHMQAEIAVAAEKACDAIMYDPNHTAVLFAHRAGKVLRSFAGPLPRMAILGFNTAGEAGLETDDLPRARYSTEQIGGFGCAVAMLEHAIKEKSVDLVGRVATFSAITSETAMQNPLHKPRFAELLAIKDMTGSAGIVVAHSGTVAGLIFDPEKPDCADRIRAAEAEIDRLGFHGHRVFYTPY